jgi:zinc protease
MRLITELTPIPIALAVLLCASGITHPVVAQEAAALPADTATLPIDDNVTVGTFANGLRYFIRANGRPEARAELQLVVNVGSVLEDDDQRGIAHFVEHMAFNGTTNFPKQELVDYLERIGMRFGPEVNAYTSFDETVYMLTVPTDTAEVLETAFQVLREWATELRFDPEEVEAERGVVLEEWRLGRGAQARMRDAQFPIIFRGSRYADRLPIGTSESLESFSLDAPRRFYADWYRPDLMAVIAVGDFDVERVEELIRTHFESIPAAVSPRPRLLFEVPDHVDPLFAIASDAEATQTVVSVLYKHPLSPRGTHGDYRRSLVEQLYSQMLNERLFELTQRADPPYLGAFSGKGGFVRSKDVYSLAALVATGAVEQGLTAVLTEAERVAQHGFTPTELERAQREMIRGMERAYAERDKTNSGAYVAEYVRVFLTGEPMSGIAYEYELAQRYVPAVTLEDVNALARQLITDENRVVTVSAPQTEASVAPGASALAAVFGAVSAAAVDPYDDAVTDAPLVDAVLAPADIVEEERVDEIGVDRWVLENGVTVLLKPTDFKDDQVIFRAWSPGGTSLAPDTDFLQAMTATSVVSVGGVGQFDLVGLQKMLSDKAASVSPYISGLWEGLSGGGSPQDIETLFELIYLYVTAPRADPDAFASYRSRMAAFLENRNRSPEAAFQDTLQVTLARHHPRARPITSDVIAALELDAGLAFYRDRFGDVGDFTFVFVGAFDLDRIRPLVRTYLGNLPSTGREEAWRDVGIRAPEGVVEKVVRRGVEPKSQTVIVFTGAVDDSREHRYALDALEEVLRIRLRDRLREDLGGTYGVSVSGSISFAPYENYTVRIGFGSAPERAEELTAVVFQQLDSVASTGPLPEEVEKVREIQTRSRETNLRENGYWVSQLVGYGQRGLDIRGILEYESLVAALTADSIRDAARRHLRMDNYVLVRLYPEDMN